MNSINKKQIKDLCRVCSGAGLFSIHSRIPFFLHTNSLEHSQWTKPIAILLEECTGTSVTKDDGLPQKICTICLSYLKHASIFRQQVLTNIDNIRLASGFGGKKVDIVCNTPEAANNEQSSKQHNKNGTITPQLKNNINSDTYKHIKDELELFFCDNNDDMYTDSDDDIIDDDDDHQLSSAIINNKNNLTTNTKGDQLKAAINNFFNYTEKTFEEDDISNFHSITVNIPDEYRERKCNSCKKRFMLNDSYDTHLKECIQKKLFDFINDSQQLLLIKKHKAISSAEFVRRMIFSLKNIVKSLAMSNRNFVTPTILNGGTTSTTLPPSTSSVPSSKNIANNLLFVQTKNDKIVSKKIFQTIEQNVFCSPEHKLNKLHDTPLKNDATIKMPTAKIPNFVAKCPLCSKTFDSLQGLEMHNRQQRRNNSECSDENSIDFEPKPEFKFVKKDCSSSSSSSGTKNMDTRKKLLELLNDVEYRNEGIVDVVKLRQKSPNPRNIQLI